VKALQHARHARLRLALAGLLAAAPVLAAPPADRPIQPSDWRQANDTVGAFPRGHADVLRWEQAQPPATNPEPAPAPAATGLALPTAEAAVRLAWRLHPELARPLARIGPAASTAIAQGQWTAIDPSLQRRIDHLDEVFAVAVSARQAWLAAVAAQQRLRPQREALEAAETAFELGQRMATVGNWSALQAARVQRAALSERMNLQRAQAAAAAAQADLLHLLRQAGQTAALVLPEQLPAVPEAAMAAADLQQRARLLQAQLPDAQVLRSRWQAPLAIDTYRAAHTLARLATTEQLPTQRLITDEVLLHYNGMLKSVWDVLAEVRNRAQAEAEAIDAQRDFWLAEAQLQWVLQGGAPERLLSLGGPGGAGEAAAGPGH